MLNDLEAFVSGKIGLFDHLLREQETEEFKLYEAKRRERFAIQRRVYARTASATYRRRHPAFIAMRGKAERFKPELYAAQAGICFLCGEPLPARYEIDHFIPLTKGGTNDLDNLHAVCPKCNRRKSNKLSRQHA